MISKDEVNPLQQILFSDCVEVWRIAGEDLRRGVPTPPSAMEGETAWLHGAMSRASRLI